MNRKDYIAIAKEIKQLVNLRNNALELEGIRMTTGVFIEYMQRDNPRFDKAKFLEACGLPN